MTYDEAFEVAAVAGVKLALALTSFESAIKALGSVTPKCMCGWAVDHRGPCGLRVGE